MASLLRSAAKSPSLRAKLPLSKPSRLPPPSPSPCPSPSTSPLGGRTPPLPSRSIYAALGSAGSLIPLHSAVAAARLRSCLAPDASRWCWTAQGNLNGAPC